MRLSSRYRQRVIKPTYGSFRSRVPLRTPSGAQFTESALETETLEQLRFVPGVRDLVTQATLDYVAGDKERRYSVDIAAEFEAGDGGPTHYLIEVKRTRELEAKAAEYRDRFAAARAVAASVGGVFRVLTEAEIRTPYLQNARLLDRHLDASPAPEILRDIEGHLGASVMTVRAMIAYLRLDGIGEPQARMEIERGVAHRRIGCDLMRRFDDETVLGRHLGDEDPFLRVVRASQSGDPIGS